MRRRVYAWALVMALSACGQGLNWREVRFEGQPDRVLLPCKPEQAQRQVQLGTQSVTLSMKGCEIQDLHFTWSNMPWPSGAQSAQVLRAWQRASLLSLGADPEVADQASSVTLKGANTAPAPTQLTAQAKGGGPQAHFIWWVRAQQVHQLAVYSHQGPIPKGVLQHLTEGIELP